MLELKAHTFYRNLKLEDGQLKVLDMRESAGTQEETISSTRQVQYLANPQPSTMFHSIPHHSSLVIAVLSNLIMTKIHPSRLIMAAIPTMSHSNPPHSSLIMTAIPIMFLTNLQPNMTAILTIYLALHHPSSLVMKASHIMYLTNSHHSVQIMKGVPSKHLTNPHLSTRSLVMRVNPNMFLTNPHRSILARTTIKESLLNQKIAATLNCQTY